MFIDGGFFEAWCVRDTAAGSGAAAAAAAAAAATADFATIVQVSYRKNVAASLSRCREVVF